MANVKKNLNATKNWIAGAIKNPGEFIDFMGGGYETAKQVGLPVAGVIAYQSKPCEANNGQLIIQGSESRKKTRRDSKKRIVKR